MIADLLVPLLLLVSPVQQAPDSLDAFIRAQLAQRQVPGLSIAVVDHGRLVLARGYGVTAPGGTTPVTPATSFLAGSVSKSVAALGALRLVEAGTLSLDGDVNERLTSWKVPENGFTVGEKVTLRRILSHTAGLTVHGFGGYAVGDPVPTLPQVLDGTAPANSPPVRVDTTPGSRWRYSGGGYTVMQLLMQDVTGTEFASWMAEHVLVPLGMTRSAFRQPPDGDIAATAASGQYAPGTPVPGRWHLYPEMAAAGLWTNPTDLARFIMQVQAAYEGRAAPVISQAMTRQMLTIERDGDGLGVFVDTTGGRLLFSHGGRDDGFDTFMEGDAASGRGIVMMINANDNSNMMRRIREFVARQYGWSGTAPRYAVTPVKVPQTRLASIAGRYEAAENQMLALVPGHGGLVSLVDGLPDRVFVPTSEWEVTSDEGERRFRFLRDDHGRVTGFSRDIDGKDRVAPRIGPLLANLPPARDPAPARTVSVTAALRALAAGRDGIDASSQLAAGAKADFGGPQTVLAGFDSLTFLRAEPVAGRGIERHHGSVAEVRAYRLNGSTNGRFVLVYLTADGLVTDYDVVNE